MEVRIEKKEAFTVTGIGRDFTYEDCYPKIPLMWSEDRGDVLGVFGVCIDHKDHIHYMIADLYQPWEEVKEESFTFEAGLWAIFPIAGQLPEALQSVNTQVWNDWVPNNGKYQMRINYNIELYAPPTDNPEDTYSEIWVPVEEIEQ